MQRTITKFLLIFLAIFVFIGCATTTSSVKLNADSPIAEKKPKLSEFVFGAGDEIEINVYRNDELNRKILIPPDGIIFYPLLGEFQVSGMSATKLRHLLTEGLKNYIVDPQVSISIVSLKSNKVFVLGEVEKPGVFQINGSMNIIEAITMAGGFTLDAKQNNVLLVRGEINNPEINSLNLKDFLVKGEIKENVSLQKGDIIYVPTSYIANVDRFFKHLYNIISPIVLLETGIVLEPLVEDAISGEKPPSTIILQTR